MSKKNRRQKELEDLLATSAAVSQEQSDHEDEDESLPKASTSAFAGFAALDDTQEALSESDDEPADIPRPKSSSKKKKKKKKAATTDTPADQPSKSATPNKKSDPTKITNDDDLDEIDRALKSLGIQPSAKGKESTSARAQAANATLQSIRSLLSIEAKFMDADEELKRFFGAKVISTAPKQQVKGARQSNPHHAASRARTILAKPERNWPPAHLVKSGMTMETSQDTDEGTVFTFEHGKNYREVTGMFLSAVQSLNPNELISLLQVHPYHAETLLGLSDMFNQQGDQGMSIDMLNRALYAYEKSFATNYNMSSGNCRLEFDRIESRGFFRAVERKVTTLIKRGTWRTAFEHAKLLLALDPFDDPYGSLLFLDFLAIQAGGYTWLLDLLRELPLYIGADSIRVESYPGLAYSKALAMWHTEENSKKDHVESSKTLRQAILRFPAVLPQLFEKLQITPPKAFRDEPRTQSLSHFATTPSYLVQLLSQLYVHQSFGLYRQPEIQSWLQEVAKSVKFGEHTVDEQYGKQIWKEGIYENGAVPSGIYRHILVSDAQPIRALLPNKVLNSQSFAFDPLPPKGATSFDNAYLYNISKSPNDRQQGSLERGIDTILQMLRGGQQLPGLENHPEVAAWLEQEMARRDGGAMPGTFPGADSPHNSDVD